LPDILKICWSGRLHKWMYMNIYIYIYIYIYAYLIMLVHVMLSSSFFLLSVAVIWHSVTEPRWGSVG
jgi:hypothetical protein